MPKNFFKLIKKLIWSRVAHLKSLRDPSVGYCVNNRLLPSVITRLPADTLRDMLALPTSEHKTQLNQDIFALLMNAFQPGFFLEIGANDGFTLSNTVYLEQEFGWKGILIEANPKYINSLSARKNSVIVNKAVSTNKEKAVFVDAGLHGGLENTLDSTHHDQTANAKRIMVECLKLQEILDTTAAPLLIDFISIDVEGAEVSIVEQMVSGNRRFRCGCCEHNYRQSDYFRMARLLKDAGYSLFWEGQTMQDLFFIDKTLRSGGLENSIG